MFGRHEMYARIIPLKHELSLILSFPEPHFLHPQKERVIPHALRSKDGIKNIESIFKL
jgi:hypothetical protein